MSKVKEKASGLLGGSNARVYRDGRPGEGVLECTVLVPVDRPLELRNLNPGTYVVADEAGNEEHFVVDALAESAWVPVQGAEFAQGGGSAGPGTAFVQDSEVRTVGVTVPEPEPGAAPAPDLAVVPEELGDGARVPAAPGSALVTEEGALREPEPEPADEAEGFASDDHAGDEPPAEDDPEYEEPEETREFDPVDHTVEEVKEYLAGVDDEEADRVLEAERQSENPRKTLVGGED